MRSMLYALSFMMLAGCHAVAAQMTVGDLLKLCSSSSGSDKTACSFYILGVTEGASLGSGTAKDKAGTYREVKDKPFCVPQGVTSAAMEFLVKKSMGEDLALFPADNSLPAVSFVVAVMSKQFPCEKPHR
jgi:hypothetical protein